MAKGRAALASILNSSGGSSRSVGADPKKVGKVGACKQPSESVAQTSRNDDGSGAFGDEDWERKSTSISAWVKSNPLKLGVPNDGSIETINAQLLRGENYPDSRRKAWHHILLELSCCGGIEALNFDASDLLSSMKGAFVSLSDAGLIKTAGGGGGRTNSSDAENVAPSAAAGEEGGAVARGDGNGSGGTSECADSDTSKCKGVDNCKNQSNHVGGGGSKAIFALRAVSKESLHLDKETSSEPNAASSDARPVIEIPVISGDSLENLKKDCEGGNAAAPQSKSASPAIQDSNKTPMDAHGRSLESLSARNAVNSPRNFKEMENKFGGVGGGKDKQAPPPRKGEKKAKRAMTMMERQELWMAKKKEKVLAQQKAAEEVSLGVAVWRLCSRLFVFVRAKKLLLTPPTLSPHYAGHCGFYKADRR